MSLSKILYDAACSFSDDSQSETLRITKLNYVKKLIKCFSDIKNIEIEIEIFGSYRLGNHLKNSDIDIGIKFNGKDNREEIFNVRWI